MKRRTFGLCAALLLVPVSSPLAGAPASQSTPTPAPVPTPTPTGRPASIVGSVTVGSSIETFGNNRIGCWRFKTDGGFSATHIKLYLSEIAAGSLRLALYSDDNGKPGAFLMGTEEIISPKAGWAAFALTASQPIAAGDYWLAVWSNAGFKTPCESGRGTGLLFDSEDGDWTKPLPAANGVSDCRVSLYAYCGAPAPVPTPVPPKPKK